MTADFGLISNTTEGDTNKLTAQGSGHGAAQGGFPDAGRPDKTQDRSLDFFDKARTARNSTILSLTFFKPVVIGVKNLFRSSQI